jgi:hypothetical protein
MHLLVGKELTPKQTAENPQSQGIGLTDIGRSAQPVAHLSECHTTHDGEYKPYHHLDDIIGRSTAYRDIDELPAEPHHEQPEGHLTDAHYDT